jgi:ferritin
MSDQSGSSRLLVLFEAALEYYKQRTGIELVEHPLAERLQDGSTVQSVAAILHEQAQDFKQFREKDKVLKPLKNLLTVLNTLTSVADFAQDVGLVRP